LGNVKWTTTQPHLWIASYSSVPGPLPNGFSTWSIWQYSDTGRVNGIGGYVDLDAVSANLQLLSLQPKTNEPIKLIDQNHM